MTYSLENWRSAEPALTPQIRLLLLLSRMTLSEEQVDRARELCGQIDDWPAFARAASLHFVAPLCLHHFSRLDNLPGSDEARAALRAVCRQMMMQTLAQAAVQRHFMEHVVLPLAVPHAAIKGRALAARYYPDPSLRFCRDFDILLPVSAIPEAIMSAQKVGYRTDLSDRVIPSGEATVLARNKRVVKLFGKDNILIEVHAWLDKAGFLFDEKAILARAEQAKVDEVPTGMPSTADQFVFICLHHTKHFWSRLSWLADLDAMISAPDFDRDAVMRLARERGLDRTVSTCLDFHAACASPDPWRTLPDDAPARDLLRVCLINLSGGPETEFRLRPDRLSMDFNFSWQIPDGFRRRQKWRSLRTLFQPNIMDFRTLALPRRLYWLYYPLKPALYLARRSGMRSVQEAVQ